MSTPRPTVRIVGAPVDLGQSRRGVDLGPTALRYAGLAGALTRLGYRVEDHGNIPTVERDALDRPAGIGFLPEVVEACRAIHRACGDALAADAIPLVVGGDHSIAVGTVGGVSHEWRTGVLWIDAHGDFNTPETSPSGNLHGMPLAALCGHGAPELVNLGSPEPRLQPEDVVLFGVRDLDPGERDLIQATGVSAITMRQIDERGVARMAREALDRLDHVDHLHVSLDMDVVDPHDAPGVGTQVPGGLNYRESHLLMELLAEHGKVRSVDVVEINPILDTRNRTARLALGLLSSLFGRSILGPSLIEGAQVDGRGRPVQRTPDRSSPRSPQPAGDTKMTDTERQYWLMKTEPGEYSIDDLERDGTTYWDGVRNYQARNFMRDRMRVGDGVLFYHSVTKPVGVVGLARVCSEVLPCRSSTQTFAPSSRGRVPSGRSTCRTDRSHCPSTSAT